MRLRKAKKIIKNLANGKYHSVSYQISEYFDGEIKHQCQAYIDGLGDHRAETWREVVLSVIEKFEEIEKMSTGGN